MVKKEKGMLLLLKPNFVKRSQLGKGAKRRLYRKRVRNQTRLRAGKEYDKPTVSQRQRSFFLHPVSNMSLCKGYARQVDVLKARLEDLQEFRVGQNKEDHAYSSRFTQSMYVKAS